MALTRIALREVAAHKARMVLALLAVALGTAFVAGTLVFRDTVHASEQAAAASSAADVTVVPRSGTADHQGGTGLPQTLAASVRDEAARASGALSAVGRVSVPDVTVVFAHDGVQQSAAVTAADWPTAPSSQMYVAEGRAPADSTEAALTAGEARGLDVRVGDRIRVLAVPGAFEVTVVGIAESRGERVDAGVYLDTVAAQRRLLGAVDQFTSVAVTAAPGVSDERLKQHVYGVLADPARHTVRTRDEEAETRSGAAAATADLVAYVMLGFAGISLLVGVFLIGNTFSMLAAARTRHSGLLRALGAARKQVRRLALAEAVVVGAAGATAGLGMGIGFAVLLVSMSGSLTDGADLSGGLVLRWPTPVAVYAVGLLTTLAAAWLPARRSGRVPPMTALTRAALPEAARSLRTRNRLAAAAGAAGVVALVLAGTTSAVDQVTLLGAGILLTLVGMVAGAPVLCVVALRVVGPMITRRRDPVGRLARGNAVRDARRTGTTAAALMIGLSLVGFLALIASSLVASVDGQLDRTMRADYFVMSDRPMTASVARTLQDTPGLERVTPQKTVRADLITEHGTAANQDLTATTADFAEDFRLRFVAGNTDSTLAEAGPDNSGAGASPGITVSQDMAETHHLKVGDPLQVRFHGGSTARVVVGGIVRDGDLFSSGATYIGLGTVAANLPPDQMPLDDVYFATAAVGADRTEVYRALARNLEPFPHVKVRDQDSYKQALHDSVGTALYLVYALLALAVVVAVLGVVNTLALSVIERTRELGLLRAVGMTRRQIRRMIRTESVVIAVVGAVLGVTLGLTWGVVCRSALSDRGLDTLVVPWATIAAVLVGAVLTGVAAAWIPARRAARMDVLAAIASDG
ncbi:ABC transporter permease [Yinghuangia sp. ASG 101]|uniref:ABC transporter permease n=1 Tax=Yinghuangia sp. ASG 101 TaxID=2896848 RepID=UPI001E378305|nr:ABC transporter permease [Yinghuangia sp. ASG 101]UGQ12082.1 ABC transporter permease [Yinghuangia sp. ASG 101]